MNKQTLFALAFATVATLAPAGDLNPPGAPAPTMVTLDQLNTGIAAATAAGNDAELAANAAEAAALGAQDTRTAINGLPGTPTATHEITAPGSYYLTANVTGESGKSGILISSNNVSIDLNGFVLVGVPGATRGIDLTASANRQSVSISDGVVRGWPAGGISASAASIVRGVMLDEVTCDLNGGPGAILGNGARATYCLFSSNTGTGLSLGGAAIGCLASSNTGNGFQINGTASDCVATSNTLAGFSVSQGALENCKAIQNTGNGIEVQASTVRGCVAESNGSNGIEAGNRSVVLYSICSFNGSASPVGAGINAAGGRSMIRGNNVSFNDFGIRCPTAGGNVVAGNIASDNTTEYNVIAGNLLGTVLTTEAAMNAATNDYANFDF